MMIRPVNESDYAACAELYNYYILHATYTFELEPLTVEQFADRAGNIGRHYPYLAAVEDGTVVGFCYLDAFNARPAYRFTADLSVYIRNGWQGRGIGKALYLAIEKAAKEMGLRKIVSIITDENAPSLKFHTRMGFAEEGHLKACGYKFGRWLGVVYMSKDLLSDRDSPLLVCDPRESCGGK